MEKVQAAVEEIFGPVNPREEMTQARLSEMTLAVRKKIEGATSEERRYVWVAPGLQTLLTEYGINPFTGPRNGCPISSQP